MRAIAEVLLTLGYRVTGSDIKSGESIGQLRRMGARIFLGHRPQNIQNSDVVVVSSAIAPDNPEIKSAREKNIPVISRAEMLAELARLKYTIAISGTHGKTTTTSLLGWIFQYAGKQPTVLIGGSPNNIGQHSVVGKGNFLITEADESDGSFLRLSPAVAVITNIDDDHLDYYRNMKNLLSAFQQFASKVPFYGFVVANGDDPNIRRVLSGLNRTYYTYGLGKNNHYQLKNIQLSPEKSSADVYLENKKIVRIELARVGQHLLLNSLAALVVARQLGIKPARVVAALKKFAGVRRRLEVRGKVGGITVIDDYGHHPTEIRATLQALRQQYPEKRLVVLFQPHRYSRTKLLYKKFPRAFARADYVEIMDIYPAGEPPEKNVSSEMIIRAWPKGFVPVKKFSRTDDLVRCLKPGDVFLTLGAGSVYKVGEEIIERLKTE